METNAGELSVLFYNKITSQWNLSITVHDSKFDVYVYQGTYHVTASL